MTPDAAVMLREPHLAPSDALLVTWQDVETPRHHAVGLLQRDRDDFFRFRYLTAAQKLPGFRPFLGFSDVNRTYVSSHLFPLFAERILQVGRPDRTALYAALGLVSSASPMDFLSRSGGQRAGDRIQLLPVPTVAASHMSCTFLVHGVRYLVGAAEAIDDLIVGQELDLEPQPDNRIDAEAVLVTAHGIRLGWVPGPLLSYVRAAMSTGDAQVHVVRANPRDLGPHLRLLVRLQGSIPLDFRSPWASDLEQASTGSSTPLAELLGRDTPSARP